MHSNSFFYAAVHILPDDLDKPVSLQPSSAHELDYNLSDSPGVELVVSESVVSVLYAQLQAYVAIKNKKLKIQSTLVISNSKGLTETLRDIRTSTYQSWENEENNKLNNHI